MGNALTWGTPAMAAPIGAAIGKPAWCRASGTGIIACLTRAGQARVTNPPPFNPERDAAASRAAASGSGAAPGARDVTRLLADLRAGDRQALEQLIPVVYGELRD